MYLHWILNPGLFILEIFFGIRVPKIVLVEKDKTKTRFERTYYPCPHCGHHHDSRTWSPQNRTHFKNWFGLYCNNCGDVIPCHKNIVTAILYALSYPVRILFQDKLKKQWLAKQPSRYQDLDLGTVRNPFDKGRWFYTGMGWAIFMYILMELIFPYFDGEIYEAKKLLVGAVIWFVAGLLFGYTMYLYTARSMKKLEAAQ